MENISTVIFEEQAELVISSSPQAPFWKAIIRDENGEIVDAHSTDIELLMIALEENCTEWLEENAA